MSGEEMAPKSDPQIGEQSNPERSDAALQPEEQREDSAWAEEQIDELIESAYPDV